jgi:hypothetical protein
MFVSLEASGQFLSSLSSLTAKLSNLLGNSDPRPAILIPISPELRVSGNRRSTWLSLIVFFFGRSTVFWDVVTYTLGIFTAHVFFDNLGRKI